jgi:predicted nucleic acid-binding protein
MSQYFVDTNILLRHLLNDDPLLSAVAQDIVRGVEHGDIVAWTSELVIAELVFVLSGKSTYGLFPAEIGERLLPIIGLPGLELAHKHMYRRVFELYVNLGIDYIDAYNVALMEREGELNILSFDRHFDRVPGLTRLGAVPKG